MDLVAKRLKAARKKVGLSQEHLGVLAGIDEASASARMNQYERGKHVPDIGTAQRIADALNVPLAYLYAVDDDEAELLLKFHALSVTSKEKVIVFIDSLNA